MFIFLICCSALAQCSYASVSASPLDTDHDGLSDTFESELIRQFTPRFMISRHDCSMQPALFAPHVSVPDALDDNGTIYAQAFPRAIAPLQEPANIPTEIELHFYHLWRTDCGRMGHPLDAEHVSVLLRGHGDDASDWQALYWYAAAHEDTVCDASQVTRASTLHAETHGATVWISQGKHGTFLDEALCRYGCGGDRCAEPIQLKVAAIINLGEPSAAMNGANWVNSVRWPLAEKMRRSDFTAARLLRLDRLPTTDIAWANPALRPAQGAIHGGYAAIDGTLTGGSSTSSALALTNRRTDTALVLAGDRTSDALGNASRQTGSALSKSFHNVRKALGTAASRTGDALDGGHPATHAADPQP